MVVSGSGYGSGGRRWRQEVACLLPMMAIFVYFRIGSVAALPRSDSTVESDLM